MWPLISSAGGFRGTAAVKRLYENTLPELLTRP